MATWLVLGIPGTPLLLAALLYLSGKVEERLLSPQSLVLSATRARRTSPEYAEAFVASQLDRLVREHRHSVGTP
jgi:hypothetical protein